VHFRNWNDILLQLLRSHVVSFNASPSTAAVSHRRPASVETYRDTCHVRGLDKRDSLNYRGQPQLGSCDVTTFARYDVCLHFSVCHQLKLFRSVYMLSCFTVHNSRMLWWRLCPFPRPTLWKCSEFCVGIPPRKFGRQSFEHQWSWFQWHNSTKIGSLADR